MFRGGGAGKKSRVVARIVCSVRVNGGYFGASSLCILGLRLCRCSTRVVGKAGTATAVCVNF